MNWMRKIIVFGLFFVMLMVLGFNDLGFNKTSIEQFEQEHIKPSQTLLGGRFKIDSSYLIEEVSYFSEENYYGFYADVYYAITKDGEELGKLRFILYEMKASQATYYHMALYSNPSATIAKLAEAPSLTVEYEIQPKDVGVQIEVVEGMIEAEEPFYLDPSAKAHFTNAFGRHFFVSAHQNYEMFEGYYKRLPSNMAILENTHWRFNLTFGDNTLSEYWMIDSGYPLIDQADTAEIDLLKRMDYDVKRQFSVLGNLYPVPSSYSGAGENHFWHNYAYHVGNKLMLEGNSLFAYVLEGVALQQLMLEYPETGYYVTPMKSEWLAADYEMGINFYDSRFNTDAAQFLAHGYLKTQEEKALEGLKRHIDFFKQYAQRYQIPTSDQGFLVMDYTDFSESIKLNHASLNHIVAEAILLYDYYQLTKDEDSRLLADQLIQGLVDLGDGWFKENGDLWYGYHPQQGFILQDYIDVTLNDLIAFKSTYYEVYATTHPFMERLLIQKQAYVDSIQ